MTEVKVPKFMSDTQCAMLIMALSAARGEKGFTEKEAGKLVTWAEWIHFQKAMITMALKGDIIVDVGSDTPGVDDVSFLPTAQVLQPEELVKYKELLEKVRTAIGLASSGEIKIDPSS